MHSKTLFSNMVNNTHTGIQTEACSKRLAISHKVKNEYVTFASDRGTYNLIEEAPESI